MALHALSLCSGIGGLDLALRQLGVVSVGYVERDAYAAAVLVARMEEAALDRAPIWSDLATFNPHAWRGGVDLVCAGYPCQPFSQAGLRLGASDPRHLWPHVRRIIDGTGCVGAVLENVSGHVRLGLREVLRDLAAIGFHAEWGLFTAAEAGAPHRRERLFVLAYRDVAGLRRLWSDRLLDSERASFGHDAYGRSGSDCALVDAHGPRLEKRGEGAHEGREEPGRGHEAVGDAGLARLKGRMPTESRGRRRPPGPSDRVEWARVLDRDPLLAPAVSPLCGVAHGAAGRLDADGRAAVFADRVDRLRCLGNAVSPDQAVLAIQELVRRALT